MNNHNPFYNISIKYYIPTSIAHRIPAIRQNTPLNAINIRRVMAKQPEGVHSVRADVHIIVRKSQGSSPRNKLKINLFNVLIIHRTGKDGNWYSYP